MQSTFRTVEPYTQLITLNTKARWQKQTLLSIFLTDPHFSSTYTQAYITEAILNGKILVNGKPCTVDTKLILGDVITHEVIRQETPVLNLEIKILHECS